MAILLVPLLFCGGLLFLANFCTVVVIWGIHYSNKLSEGASRAYRAAAAHVGLTQVVENRFLGWVMSVVGLAGPFRVWIGYYRKGTHEKGTRITVSGNGQIPYDLDLRAEGLSSQMGKALGSKEIVIGDAGFDREIYARGPEDVLRAMCDVRTRSLLRALVRLDGVVADGGVRVETAKAPRDVDPVAPVLQTAVDLARCLLPPENIVERLADLVRSDPKMGVREHCLAYLVRTRPEHPTVAAVIREALAMPSPELRVRAAIALGAEGRETLLGLVGSTDLDAECAADGIRALGEALSEARGIEILQEALRRWRRPVAEAVIETLRLRGTAAAVPPLRAASEAHAFDAGLRRKAHEAIARIQSRLEDAAAGRISLAEGLAEVGQLSLADGAAGRVSLDQPAGERRSVPSKPTTETK